jgi:hypothetical protein
MDRGTYAVIVTDVRKNRFDLTYNAVGAHEPRLVGAADSHAHTPAFLGHAARDITANKARSAENGDKLRHVSSPPVTVVWVIEAAPAPDKAQIVPSFRLFHHFGAIGLATTSEQG